MFRAKDLQKVIIETQPVHDATAARFGPFEVDFRQQELRKHGIRIHLQHKPFQILELLLRRPGVLIARPELARALWPDSHVSFERGLNTAMNMLRQALGDSAPASRFIETRAGLGYCFIAPVELMREKVGKGRSETNDDCLKGCYFLDKLTEEDARKAAAHFEAALQYDADCVAATAGLVDAWCQMAELGALPPAIAAARAREYAIAAVSANSQDASAHTAMGRVRAVFDWDWKRACASLKRALELQPKLAGAHRTYAAALAASGETDLALEHIRIACALDPLSLQSGVEYSWLLQANGNFQAAADQCWKVLTLDPRCWLAQLSLGVTYGEMQMHSEAVAEFENAVLCSGRHPIALSLLAYFSDAEPNAILLELASQQTWRYINPLSLAFAHAHDADLNRSQDCMQQAIKERDPLLVRMARTSAVQHMGGVSL